MFDFIIVGAGAAGCVLADRLSADGRSKVCVIEAGGSDKATEVQVPAGFSKLFRTGRDWAYATAPQAQLNGRAIFTPRGRMLGGSSSINAQMYIRGHPADFDAWDPGGNTGWRYEDVLPYFRRSERNGRGADAFHGADGPLHVQDQRDPNPLSLQFIEACAAAGLGTTADFNGTSLEGAALTQVTQKRGRRWSAADAFLKPALRRGNLTVMTDATVERIMVEDGRATGVRARRGGRNEDISAAREVVLCAGSYNTPQILMLSGIGPGDHLRDHGIDVVRDAPNVGRNLIDHMATGVHARIGTTASLYDAETFGQFLRYLALRRGKLSSNVGEAPCFVRSSPDLPAPDIELLFAPCLYVEEGLAPPPEHGVTIAVIDLQPLSRGEVRLASSDPSTAPVIDPRYLTDPDGRDMATHIHGIRLARRIFATQPLSAVITDEINPGREVTDDEGLAAHVRQLGQTLYHPVGTCAFGSSPETVVDPRLCVRGVDRLRIADASVMPTIVRGHTQAPTVMVAERAADLILQPA